MTFRATKDPQADLDYAIDWSAWLGTDTILTSAWRVASSSGIVLHNDVADGKKATVWMRGGAASGDPHLVVNRVVTAAGRTEERTIAVMVEQR